MESIIIIMSVLALMVMNVVLRWWLLPYMAYMKLRARGFSGPNPSFPLGNLNHMKIDNKRQHPLSNDIHSTVVPYFAKWQKSHGKVFVYWIGTEPFLYIAEPEFLKQMSAEVKGRDWGKATALNRDREPMFGNGLVTIDGDEWLRHRHVITPAFSPPNLKGMVNVMSESATSMVERWATLINSGRTQIDVEKEIIRTAGEIIARTSFGITNDNGREVLEKLRSLQYTLFKSNRYVGVPFGHLLNPNNTITANKLGKEIDNILKTIINHRRITATGGDQDLLGLLLAAGNDKGAALTTNELVDECKTFFFGGHETTALALSWTLFLLAVHPEWQTQLREEIREVIGDHNQTIDAATLAKLKKMGWVMNEALRLYCPAPNAQRQARHDIRVGNKVIPKGTNIWVDIVSMHHDHDLWGDDVNEFKPERFKDDMHGGCKHKMGFLPFGFAARMCVGRNLTKLEYRVVLTLILSKFSFSLSPEYRHSPTIMLSLRPMHGLPLIVHPL